MLLSVEQPLQDCVKGKKSEHALLGMYAYTEFWLWAAYFSFTQSEFGTMEIGVLKIRRFQINMRRVSIWLNFGMSWCSFFPYIQITNLNELVLFLLLGRKPVIALRYVMKVQLHLWWTAIANARNEIGCALATSVSSAILSAKARGEKITSVITSHMMNSTKQPKERAS